MNTNAGNDCYEYLEDQKDQIIISMNEFSGDTTEETIESYFAGINAIIEIGYNSDDTFQNCFDGGLDAVKVYENYSTLPTDLPALTTNLIENFGLAYNGFRDILTYFLGLEESNIDGGLQFGKSLGYIFFYILYPGAEEGEIVFS